MPKQITHLTDEQRAQMEPWARKWIANGLRTGDTDWDTFESAMSECYRAAKLAPPRVFVRCPSPLVVALAGPIAAHRLKSSAAKSVQSEVHSAVGLDSKMRSAVFSAVDSEVISAVDSGVLAAVDLEVLAPVHSVVGSEVDLAVRLAVNLEVDLAVRSVASEVRSAVRSATASEVGLEWNRYLGGHLWSYWAAWTSYFVEVCGLDLGPLASAELAYRRTIESAGWSWPHTHFCMVSARPTELHRDDAGLLHRENGPAIIWPDGWGVYSWHGTQVPKEWILSPESMSPETALTWPNVEQRRAAAEIVGWGRVLDQLQCETIDADPDPLIGTLLRVVLPGAQGAHDEFLRVRCPTGRDFALCVTGMGYTTALQAQSGLNQIPESFIRKTIHNRT